MNVKIISAIIIFGLITIIPTVYGQLTLGSEAIQELTEVRINSNGEISVKHIVKATNSGSTLSLFDNAIIPDQNLFGENEIGTEIQLGIINDGLGNKSIFILPSKYNVIIEYSLPNASLNDNLFSTVFSYNEKFSIIFDESIELIFVNNNAIFFGDKKGISINGGGDAEIKFYENKSKIIKEASWEENKFDVEIITDSEIQFFNFNQPEKSISFQINDENNFVVITMSEELLGGPYVVMLDDEKIKYTKFIQEDNKISLNFKPESTGEITIIGTTVIPEFSMFIPLIMGFMIIVTVPLMRKFSLH